MKHLIIFAVFLLGVARPAVGICQRDADVLKKLAEATRCSDSTCEAKALKVTMQVEDFQARDLKVSSVHTDEVMGQEAYIICLEFPTSSSMEAEEAEAAATCGRTLYFSVEGQDVGHKWDSDAYESNPFTTIAGAIVFTIKERTTLTIAQR